MKDWDLSSSDKWNAVDEFGVAGQGNSNPLAVFGDHALVQIGTQIYDPSCGIGPCTSTLDWENDIKVKDVENTYIISIKDDDKIFINDKEKTIERDHIKDYTTEEDKARISKLKKQRDEWYKKKYPEIK